MEHWRHIEAGLPELEDGKPISAERLHEAVMQYPELARDLATARREAPRSRVTAYLEFVYTRLHRALFRPPRTTRDDLRRFFSYEVPGIVADLRWRIVSVTLGFVLAGFCGWWLVWSFPELAALFASESMIDGVRNGELWTEGMLNIMPSSLVSIRIFTNNILVALTTMCLGVLYGLGTIYIIGLNGLMLGGVFALTAQYGMADELFEFVVAHGMVELSVIVVAGAIGFSMGEALARPGHRSRIAAFQRAARRGAKLMTVCVAFLIGAGLIEGYVSPDPGYTLPVRLAIGFSYWLLFLLALAGWKLHWSSRRGDPTTVRRDVAA